MKNSLALAVLYAFAVLAPGAKAQLASVSPFPGYLSESFESFPTSFTTSPLSIMGGAASVQTPDAISIYDASSWYFSLGSSSANAPGGCALGANGPRGLGLEFGPGQAQATITFNNPVNAFGGFWGAGTMATNPGTISIEFFDVANQMIGVPQSFEYLRPSGDGMLEWHGWASDVPIAKVVLTADGPTVVADDLRISFAPHLSSISRENSGKVKLIGHGVAGQVYTLQGKADLATANWIGLGTATANAQGMVQFEDVTAPAFASRFYRLVRP
jgi:hypothetical protein